MDEKADTQPKYSGAASINNADEVLSKQCSKCEQYKPLDAFYNSRDSVDGKRLWCKACFTAYGKEYYAKNAERIAKRMKEPEVAANIAAYAAKYYAKNKERIDAYNAAWEAAHAAERKQQRARNRARRKAERAAAASKAPEEKANGQ
jgi:hypothetical protein